MGLCGLPPRWQFAPTTRLGWGAGEESRVPQRVGVWCRPSPLVVARGTVRLCGVPGVDSLEGGGSRWGAGEPREGHPPGRQSAAPPGVLPGCAG